MRIVYIPSNYASHRRAAQSYCRLLGESHSLVSRLDQADVVILHEEPHDYASIFRRYHLDGKYVVAFAVWEADDLPDAYKRSLQYVQEVWTPSRTAARFSLAITHACTSFRMWLIRLWPFPTATASPPASKSAIDGRCIYFLTITKVWDRRKNVQCLIDTFETLRGEMPDARLIIKACEGDVHPRLLDPRVTIIYAHLPDSQIGALYECCDVYVSPHHSEGWGLTLADALVYQKPTIATGYSGNLEFMDESNSFLLAFDEDYIHQEDVFGLFTTRMRWAYPSPKDLADKLLRLRSDSEVRETVRCKLHAAANMHRFDPCEVAKILRFRLEGSRRGGLAVGVGA